MEVCNSCANKDTNWCDVCVTIGTNEPSCYKQTVFDKDRMQYVMPDAVIGCDAEGKVIFASFILQQIERLRGALEEIVEISKEDMFGYTTEGEIARKALEGNTVSG